MKSNILKLEPFYSEKVWGYEQWVLSTHKNGSSKIKNSNMKMVKQSVGIYLRQKKMHL